MLARNPRAAVAANNLAYIVATEGDLERGLELAKTAHELAPQDPQVADTLGWIYYLSGTYRAALTLLRESAAKLPKSAEVQYHLGMVHYRLGNTAEAGRALTRSLELDPGHPGAEEARQTLQQLR